MSSSLKANGDHNQQLDKLAMTMGMSSLAQKGAGMIHGSLQVPPQAEMQLSPRQSPPQSGGVRKPFSSVQLGQNALQNIILSRSPGRGFDLKDVSPHSSLDNQVQLINKIHQGEQGQVSAPSYPGTLGQIGNDQANRYIVPATRNQVYKAQAGQSSV